MDEVGTVTFSAVQPRVGVPLTASLTDIDGGVSNVTWQWYRRTGTVTVTQGDDGERTVNGADIIADETSDIGHLQADRG